MLKNLLGFDAYNRLEAPPLVLCEVSKEPICTLFALDVSLSLNFTDISSVKFRIPSVIDGEEYKHYEDVIALRMIHLPHIGYFQLTSVSEVSDGFKEYKECEALSAQVMLQSKRITGVVGEYKLWNPVKPQESLMGLLLTLAPSWKIGTVDGIFLTRQRSINITESDLYSMMTNEFYDSFEAIFVFDYEKYEINIYDAKKEFKDTEIFIATHNVLKSYQVEPQVEKIITALRVIGGDGLDISGVNPNGTDTIYNVSAFVDRMSVGLQNALKAYEMKYNSLKKQYSELLIQYKNKNAELSKLQSNAPLYDVSYTFNRDGTAKITPSLTSDSGLAQLEGLKANLENVKATRIQSGNIPYSDVNSLASQVSPMISSKKSAISTVVTALNGLVDQINGITAQLNMEKNFTPEKWVELNEYLRYDTVQENAFIITDIMSQEEKQKVRQELLEHGELILRKSCYPTFLYRISCVNFLALPEFSRFQDEFELGTTFTLKVNDNYIVKPMLLGVRINFNSLEDFDMIFGNKTNVNDGFDFSAYKNAVSAGASISFDLVKIEALKAQKDDVAEFLKGSLIAATNNIKSTEDYTVATINEDGIRLRQYDSNTKAKQNFEAWLTGSTFAFSDDSFQTSKLALGRIQAPKNPNGYVYGLNAEVIAGNFLISQNLLVKNVKNTFTVDENGASLVDANFTLTKTIGGVTNKIVLDPNEGFAIYKGTEKQIFLGTDGNVNFKGEVNGGSININNQFTVDKYGKMDARNAIIKGTIESSSFKGGSIDIGNGQFTVSSSGYVVCNDICILNGVMESSYLKVDRSGKITSQNGNFTNGYFKGNVYAESGYFKGEIHAEKGTFNGTLSSNVVYTGKLSADQINSGTISAINISGSNISGSKISGGTISGSNVTGTFIYNCLEADITLLHVSDGIQVRGRDFWKWVNDLQWEQNQHTSRISDLQSRVSALEKK